MTANEEARAKEALDRGMDYLKYKDYLGAIMQFDLVATDSSAYDDAYIAKCEATYYQGQPDLAILNLNRIGRTNPNYHDAQFLLGCIHFETAKYDRAIENLISLPDTFPAYEDAQLLLGHIFREKKEYVEALEFYSNVLVSPTIFNEAQRYKRMVQKEINANLNTVNKSIEDKFTDKVEKLEDDVRTYSLGFKICVFLTILAIMGSIAFNIFVVEGNLARLIQFTISFSSILALSLWLAKYYNRRIHETIQLKEDYEHKRILLSTFKAYGEQIQHLLKDNPSPLLDFTKQVSNAINKNPADSLNKKKGDKIPIADVIELTSAIRLLVESKEASSKKETDKPTE